MGRAVVAALLAVLALGAWAETERFYSHGFLGAAELQELEARYRARAVPSLRFSLGGTIARLPETGRLYFDAAVFDPSTIVVNAHSASRSANCSDLLRIHEEHASFELSACVGGLLDAEGHGSFSLVAEVADVEGAVETLETEIELIATPQRPWPLANDDGVWPPALPNLAGNIMENYQSFSGAASAYWHQGVDIRGEALQPVYSPVDGTVVQWVRYQTSELYWSFMIEDELGFIWQFHHMDPDTVSLDIGDRVSAGDMIGRIIFWPSVHNGANYHHIHMNVVRPHPSWNKIPEPYVDGWQYYNPLIFLDPGSFNNTKMPFSDGVFYYFEDEASTAFASSEEANVVVSGDIDIVVNLGSEFDATNSIPGHPYVNGLFEVAYSVEPLDIKDAEARKRATIERLPLVESEKLPNEWTFTLPDLPVAETDALLRYVYRQSFTYRGTRHTSVFDYNRRELYYTVTNTIRGEPDSAGAWHTAERLADGSARFPNGAYRVSVYARDFYGNDIELSHEVTVQN